MRCDHQAPRYNDLGLWYLLRQKISPVLNGQNVRGITYNRFEEREPSGPGDQQALTAVMLSHVYALKDVMNAIKAAGVIINEIGFHSYRFLIYGSDKKDVPYPPTLRKPLPPSADAGRRKCV